MIWPILALIAVVVAPFAWMIGSLDKDMEGY